VANSHIADYLSAADLMVLPSETEGTPTVLVEAGAARLPVVATAVGGIPDLLADNRGLLTECGNMDSLVGAVQATLTDSRASTQRADRLYTYVTRNYDCVKNGRKLKQLYAQLAAGVAFGGASAA
jgi:teichuronic acid biosynthesis glycosyltransferase TuaC